MYSYLFSTKYCALLISTEEILNVRTQLKQSKSRLHKLRDIQESYRRFRRGIFNIIIGPGEKQKEQAYEQLQQLFHRDKKENPQI
tara:strand:- start:470 stop:724 length:255 start_codon:yes stop_codon:yes gene_type:complete